MKIISMLMCLILNEHINVTQRWLSLHYIDNEK